MKNRLILMVAMFFGLNLTGQNILNIEYWIDSDPGFGEATPVTGFDQNSSVEDFLATSEANLDVGNHLVGIRSQDENGIWGLTNFIQVRVLEEPVEKDIVTIEYFWSDGADLNDPYFDSAAQVMDLPQGSDLIDVTFEVPVPEGAENGDQLMLFVRSADSDARWSLTTLVAEINGLTTRDYESQDQYLYELYPNPSDQNIFIEVQQKYPTNGLKILDQHGRIVMEMNLTTGVQNIDLSNLSSGLYIARFINENGFVSKKLIVQ